MILSKFLDKSVFSTALLTHCVFPLGLHHDPVPEALLEG